MKTICTTSTWVEMSGWSITIGGRYIWEKERVPKNIDTYSLVHVDYHWDGGNDFHNYAEREKELIGADLDTIYELVAEDKWIRFDSFISPAVIRGIVSEVHFYCKQYDGNDIGIDNDLLKRTGTVQEIHDSLSTLTCIEPKDPLIFDFCLDIFNRSDMWYQGEIWRDEEVTELLESCRELVRKAELVTVSLSFGYSGTEEDTRRLADMTIPILQRYRNDSQQSAPADVMHYSQRTSMLTA